MDEQELKKLAIDISENKIFGTFHLSDHETSLLGCVFMPLMFMNDEQADEMKDVAHFYEYLSAAGPLAVSGMPTFTSMRTISKEAWPKIVDYIKAYEKQKTEFLEEG